MKKFVISTDSCVDHFKSYLEQNDVYYIILKRITDGVVSEEIYDSFAEFEHFYDELRNGALPTTSLLNEYEMTEHFQNILTRTEGDIIHIPLSSGLSTTCQNAIFAAESLNSRLCERKIYVVDSLSATRGMAMLVDRLIEMRDMGMCADDAIREIERIRDHQQVFAIIGDLKHLKRGGRISGFKAKLGTLLGIKPILIINSKGKLVIERTIKGEKKSIHHILTQLEKNLKRANSEVGRQTVYLLHSSESRLLLELEAAISDRFSGISINKGMIGPIIGTHVGDGTVGIIFEGEKRLDID